MTIRVKITKCQTIIIDVFNMFVRKPLLTVIFIVIRVLDITRNT